MVICAAQADAQCVKSGGEILWQLVEVFRIPGRQVLGRIVIGIEVDVVMALVNVVRVSSAWPVSARRIIGLVQAEVIE